MPKLPARADPELYAYLKYLRSRIERIDKTIGVDSDSGSDDDALTFGEFVADTATHIAGNTHGTVTTEDAWTAVSAGAPAGARYAWFRREVNSTDNADSGDLAIRTPSGVTQPGPRCVALAADARDSDIVKARLSDAGEIEYLFTNTSGTTIDWALYYVGYEL